MKAGKSQGTMSEKEGTNMECGKDWMNRVDFGGNLLRKWKFVTFYTSV
jgi:hypothetical protein